MVLRSRANRSNNDNSSAVLGGRPSEDKPEQTGDDRPRFSARGPGPAARRTGPRIRQTRCRVHRRPSRSPRSPETRRAVPLSPFERRGQWSQRHQDALEAPARIGSRKLGGPFPASRAFYGDECRRVQRSVSLRGLNTPLRFGHKNEDKTFQTLGKKEQTNDPIQWAEVTLKDSRRGQWLSLPARGFDPETGALAALQRGARHALALPS